MKESLLIESGGTKSDWFCKYADGHIEQLLSVSMHPKNIESNFVQLKTFIRQHALENLPVTFYGAGCFKSENKEFIAKQLKLLQLSVVEVESDLKSAVLACKKPSGWVAILGTGSVLVRFSNNEVEGYFGGAGHINGDEGSGYYFGKLIIQYWNDKKLSKDQLSYLDISQMMMLDKMLSAGEGKSEIAALAKLLSGNNLFNDIHRKNIQLFIEKYCLNKGIIELSAVGGYVNGVKSAVKELFQSYKIHLVEVVECPGIKLIA